MPCNWTPYCEPPSPGDAASWVGLISNVPCSLTLSAIAGRSYGIKALIANHGLPGFVQTIHNRCNVQAAPLGIIYSVFASNRVPSQFRWVSLTRDARANLCWPDDTLFLLADLPSDVEGDVTLLDIAMVCVPEADEDCVGQAVGVCVLV